MDFTAQASGTLEQPTINANFHLRDLAFDHERAGDYIFEAVTQGSELKVSGHSQFKDAELNIDGAVQLRADWPTQSISIHHLNVGFGAQQLLKAEGNRAISSRRRPIVTRPAAPASRT